MQDFNNLKQKIDKLRSISIWSRIFNWKKYIIYITEIKSDIDSIFIENTSLVEENKKLEISERNSLNEHNTEKTKREVLQTDKIKLENKIEILLPFQSDNQKIVSELNHLKQKEHADKIKLDSQIQKYEEFENNAREREIKKLAEQEQERTSQLNILKRTWQDHEDGVNQSMRLICQEEMITFVDEWDHGKKPDNVIQICGEYIVFDAKSPRNDELSNFPTYIKSQVTSLSKYANHQDVKKHLFLVVPENTIHILKNLTYNDSNYCVHIISPQSLRIVMWSLKQIELYEFADKLSPEDRENLARVYAGSQNYIKRIVQINNDLNEKGIELIKQNIDLISKESLKGVRENALEFEKGDMINTSKQNRGKIIDVEEETIRQKEIKFKAETRTIITPKNNPLEV